MRFPGKPVALPLPPRGEGAVAVAGVGLVGYTANERSVPIASVTKIMTAYLVLQNHPLVGKGSGPIFVMTAKDHEAWIRASEADESNIEVLAGERLDERQLLQALMIPSADNIADYLASWDAGSLPAFVAKMNAEALSLGLTGTHYADASGVNPGSRSTAVDMATLASIAMQNPEFRSIVDEQSIRLPVSGEIWNVYNPAIGVDGIIGVKSGFTIAAQVNLVTAAWRTVAGHRELVVSAAIDQPLSMYGAADEDEAMLTAASHELGTATVVARQAKVGEAVAPWNHSRVPVRAGSRAVVVGWPGLPLAAAVVAAKPSELTSRRGWPAGSTIGTFEILCPFGIEVTGPALLQSPIDPPPAGWRPPGLVR
jgi:D-alanyl-D-alanine carboxypeptidase (penicillin-binding protein 5/6)